MKISLGISTCPNDTFAFHAILQRKVDLRGIDFQIELLDVQQLNDRLFQGDFHVAKASFHAALLLAETMVVLPSGSALGFGVGPLLLAAAEGTTPEDTFTAADGSVRPARVVCPGAHTTAALLYQLFHPGSSEIEHLVFSEIMPALQRKEADFGVCIHEGRFTYQQAELACVEDLGTRWEQATETPLPLGGILARRDLPVEMTEQVQQVIRDSIEYGLINRAETLDSMHRYAQELSEEVLFAHVDLYVNQWTIDLGKTGRRALKMLSQRARSAGIVAEGAAELEVFPADGAQTTG